MRTDSDVDVAVHCREVEYWDEESEGARRGSGNPYEGPWTPAKLRREVEAALRAKFGGQVDTSGSTAIAVNSSTARVDADVVPCFTYRYYFASGNSNEGTCIFRKNGDRTENYPEQHLNQGRAKNNRINSNFKRAVRILKRVENAMVSDSVHREVPSFLVECLVYNCPDRMFSGHQWTPRIRSILYHIWDNTQGGVEPQASERWVEVNECKYLHGGHQAWSRQDARDFSRAAWNYLEFS